MAPPRSKTLSDRPDIPAFRSALGSRRWTPADAQVVLAAHQESGLTLAAFARRHRLSLQRLYAWRRHLDSARRPDVTRSPQFLPVRVVGPAVEPPDPVIEIVLAGDRRVRVHGAVDAAILARVIEVLEPAAC